MPSSTTPFLFSYLTLFLTLFPLTYLASESFTRPQLHSLAAVVSLLFLSLSLAIATIKTHGLLAFAPLGLKAFLLEANILDWLTNSEFFELNVAPIVPLLLNPNYTEMLALLQQMNPDMKQALLQKGGFGRLLPPGVRQWLHPDLTHDQPTLRLPPPPAAPATPQASTAASTPASTVSSHANTTARAIFTSQLYEMLPSVRPTVMWKSSAVAFGVLFIMLSRSRVARRTGASILRAVFLLGLSGTGVGTFLMGYYGTASDPQATASGTTGKTATTRGMGAAELVLRATRAVKRRGGSGKGGSGKPARELRYA